MGPLYLGKMGTFVNFRYINNLAYILLSQQPNLNVIERKFKRKILMPDPIILVYFIIITVWSSEESWGKVE